ncbi:SGD1 [Candida pseudojiufengensis]|uniref:SGD1 n=1 Tax=Candida pseudojiufengensis TaxID=497109 RepID=UPI002224C566|nr:SGD1 [Candida pseudojiufengensis]KAI5966795.1 SGD1 [Candida pseudojiufengensis]
MKKHEDYGRIKLPESILTQINDKQSKGEYDSSDSKYETNDNKNRKRKFSKVISRKEKRKQERSLKKQKQRANPKKLQSESLISNSSSKLQRNKTPDVLVENKIHDDPLEKLRLLKESKSRSKKKKNENSKSVNQGTAMEDRDEKDISSDEDFENSNDDSDPLEALRKLKAKKNGASVKFSDIRIVKEEDLEKDDEFDEEDEFNEIENEEDDEIDEDELEIDEDESESQETLNSIKSKKLVSKDTGSEYRVIKEEDLKDDTFSEEEDSEFYEESDFEGFDDHSINSKQPNKGILKNKLNKPEISPRLLDTDMQKYDDDIDYYAKKLGLKNGRNSKLSKIDDDDEIGGLLDGIDLDFGSDFESEPYEDDENTSQDSVHEEDDLEYEANPLEKLKKLKENKQKTGQSETPTFSNPSFEQDEKDIAYYAKKLGIKTNARLPKSLDDDGLDDLLDGLEFDVNMEDQSEEISENDSSSSDEYDEYDEDTGKENPYIAPGSEKTIANEESNSGQSYIPPALRKQMAIAAGNEDSEEILNLRRSIKGPLNKLSESNIGAIVDDIQKLFLLHPRQVLFEEITTIILDSVLQQGRMLDTFVYLHACVVAALYRLQGVEFGAFFIQTLVEKFKTYHQKDSKSKEASNLISLLSSVYLFHLISSKLLYDLIKELISNLNEENADLLLRLIRSSGNQMRADDPSSLKDIITLLNEKYNGLSAEMKSSRIQFLIETISTLKNNKMKVLNEGNHQLSVRLKKFLSSINNNRGGDPIQVSLDDINSVATRGKWWLVGSAWKGADTTIDQASTNVDNNAMNDILDTAEPNWTQLAKAQRMNTDIRRAIFISIMSATDFMDARTKIDKLALKRAQERDIPKVLIHCATIEPSWNPYYAVLANNMCDSHSLRKTFQFMLWDLIKELDGGSMMEGESEDEVNYMGLIDVDEETKIKKILNLGRFFGYLIAEGSLPLHSLKTINFLTASSDTILFCEMLLVTFLDNIGKKSRRNSVGSGSKIDHDINHDIMFDDRLLVERILKAKDQETLLRGLQYFLQEKVKNTDLVSSSKQKIRVSWGVDAMFDILDEFLKSKENY